MEYASSVWCPYYKNQIYDIRDGPEMRGTILLTRLHKEGECDNHATEAKVGNPGAKKTEG